MPPKGFVIKRILIPFETTINAVRIFIPNLKYGEISFLSSTTPTIRAIKAAIKSEAVVMVCVIKNNEVKKIPRKRGIPPPRGTGFLCIIAGCLCFFGSSNRPIFLIRTRDNGVIKSVSRKEIKKGSIATFV